MASQTQVHIRQGDLTDSEVDAIVNAANTDLMLGAGVAGAIRLKGGAQVAEECRRHGPVKLGEAALTAGGSLRASYVVHAASMHLGGKTTADSLRDSVRNSLRHAREKKFKSLAFPAIGTGVAGFPMEQCAQIMLKEVLDHIKGKTLLEDIHFVLFDAVGLKAFQEKYFELTGG